MCSMDCILLFGQFIPIFSFTLISAILYGIKTDSFTAIFGYYGTEIFEVCLFVTIIIIAKPLLKYLYK